MRAAARALAVLALLGLSGVPLGSASLPASIAPPSAKPAVLVGSAPIHMQLEEGLAVNLTEEPAITVEAIPRRGEGIAAFALRLCGDAALGAKVAAVNGGAADLRVGARYAIPFELLSPEWQLKAARPLFAGDR